MVGWPKSKCCNVLYVVFEKCGKDRNRFHDEPGYRLPMPSQYVIDKQGIISAADVNADYTIRLDLPKLLGSCGC